FKDDEEFGTETQFNSWYLQFNFLEEPCDNKNIRKAFQLAFDPSSLTETVLNNGSEPAYGLVALGVHGDDDNTFRELAGDVVQPDCESAKDYLEKGLHEVDAIRKLEIHTGEDTIAKDTPTVRQSALKENVDVDVYIETKPYGGRLDAISENDDHLGISRR